MAIGDFSIYQSTGGGSMIGGRKYNVASGTPILAGEPVVLLNGTVGAVTVMPMISGAPAVSATAGVEGSFVGIAATSSTNTSSASGYVYVIPTDPKITWLVAPNVAASWTPQATYDALVGKRVLISNSTTVSSTAQNVGTYSALATDGALYGASVQALDITKVTGKVAIAFRAGTSNLA